MPARLLLRSPWLLVCLLLATLLKGAPPDAPAVRPKPTPAGTSGAAAPAAAAPAASKAEEAVRQAIKAYVAALNSGDFKTVAAYWTADGDYADPTGRTFKARAVIEEELAKRFSGPDRPKLAVDVQSIRFVSPEVALEDGQAELTPAAGGSPTRGRYTMVWVKQQNKWLISSLRELVPVRPAHQQRLSELAWLAGDWTAEGDGATVRVRSRWTPGKTFLLREIEIVHEGKVIHEIAQRIGWDPMTRRLKVWTFDADGSHAEGAWSHQGDNWQLQSRGVTRDGQATTAKNIYSEITDDGFALKSVEASVGGESRPDFTLHFKRRTEEPAKPPADEPSAR